MIKKLEINKIMTIFFMTVLLFGSDSFIAFANVNQNIKTIINIINIGSLFLLLIYSGVRITIKKTYLLTVVVLVGTIVVGMLINRSVTGGDFVKIIYLFWGFLFAQRIRFEIFEYYFIRAMIIIASASIIAFLLSPYLVNLSFLPRISNGSVELVFLGLTNIPNASYSIIERNWGPFWEPGVFQFYSNFAMLLLNRQSGKYKNIMKYNLILTIAILTTFSTTGYICLAINYVIILSASSKRDIGFKIGIVGVIVLVVMAVLLSTDVVAFVFGKISGTSLFSSSRFLSIVFNIEALIESPMFGVGTARIPELLLEFKRNNRGFSSNTNGLLMNYSYYGVIFGTIYTWLTVRFCQGLTMNRIAKICILLFMSCSLFSEPFINSILFNTIIFWGLEKNRT